MTDQISEIALSVAGLHEKADKQQRRLDDIYHSQQTLISTLAQILATIEMVNRQLDAVNQALQQEPENENLIEMLRALLIQLGALMKSLKDMPTDVANVLHEDGLVLPEKC